VEDPDGIDGLPSDSEWVGRIRVPFAVESLLSGVQMPLPLSEDLDTSDESEVELVHIECRTLNKAYLDFIGSLNLFIFSCLLCPTSCQVR